MGGRWPNSRQKHRGKTSRDALYIANSTNAKLTANSYFKLLFFSVSLCVAVALYCFGRWDPAHRHDSCTEFSLSLARRPQPPASSLQRCRQLPSARARHRPPTNFGDPASVIVCEAGHLLVCRSAPNHAWRDDLLPPLTYLVLQVGRWTSPDLT